VNRPTVVNDVTGLNPVPVFGIVTPTSVQEVQSAVKNSNLPLSIGGGHFSMGGQTASPGTLHLDLRKLNRVLRFSPAEKTIRVEAGVRWCDIQRFIDPHNLSVSVMQTYANFTVGGSLSVNVHGRYLGLGPLILSVRALTLVRMSGERVEASPHDNAELFHAAIGGYGAIGVIVEAELVLADNCRVERTSAKMRLGDYPAFFRSKVRNSPHALFHNADLYPPDFSRVRAVTWSVTDRASTNNHRLQPYRRRYPIHRYFYWAMSETKSGKWRREFLLDPLVYASKPVHWRNFEAGYDVAELEPPQRTHRTYVLQEYFIPVERLGEFVPMIAGILQRHRVNVINISVRHSTADPGSWLRWARGETFALVLYYKQRTRRNACERVAVWTRELIDAALAVNGTYYLPYQPHATQAQFLRAYPRAPELFALKRRIDPEYRLRGSLWDKYYVNWLRSEESTLQVPTPTSDFHAIYADDAWADKFYLFLQNIYRLYPEDRFHTLIKERVARHADDETIYRELQAHLPSIKPALADLRFALPALFKQKAEMLRQTLELLGPRKEIDGYVEIGSTGRYASVLQKRIALTGPLLLVNDVAPSNSPVDIMERGRLRPLGRFVPLADYAPLDAAAIPDSSIDLVTCYIGLHHIAPDKLEPFMRSLWRVLRPGGLFILRDHDVTSAQMFRFVSLVHTVFNAGLQVPWETNQAELRYFVGIEDWVRRLAAVGFIDSGRRLRQAHDPSDNLLLAFTKP
jgi:FAD/FMN-containing dehydrogenase/SAM-dependent methyltransferase